LQCLIFAASWEKSLAAFGLTGQMFSPLTEWLAYQYFGWLASEWKGASTNEIEPSSNERRYANCMLADWDNFDLGIRNRCTRR